MALANSVAMREAEASAASATTMMSGSFAGAAALAGAGLTAAALPPDSSRHAPCQSTRTPWRNTGFS